RARRDAGQGAFHLIQQLTLPPSPQGEGFCMAIRHGFPLRGRCPEGTDEVESLSTAQLFFEQNRH
ncbi:MAG: hypothetical protein J6K13_00260, partial [Clostridia bacterium]|nr:hypothetical protein [Clostridia bacterium]